MNAPETITEAINQAHDTLAHYDEAMSADQIAYELAGRIKPTKAHTKEAVKQLKQLAGLGMIEMEPRAGGVPFYRLIAAPQMGEIPLVEQKQAVAEVGDIDVVELSDSEGGETDAPAAINDTPKFGHGLSCGACHDGCAGEQCKVERDSPPVDSQREEFTLLHLIADIRSAAGDPQGSLMQDELVQHIAAIVKERDDLRERLDAQIKQWQADTGRLTSDLRAAMESRSQTINEADRLRAELAAERQAREALQEQANAVDVKDAAVGYLIRVPKRDPILRRKLDSARLAALGAVRAGAARAEVLAVVPVGAARRGAEWGEA